MLRVVIELHPAWGGCTKVLHEIKIVNMHTDSNNHADYSVLLKSAEDPKPEEVWRARDAAVQGFDRNDGAVALAARCIAALLKFDDTKAAPKKKRRKR